MAIVFDGKNFAAEKEEVLKGRVFGLKTRGVHPKLASIIIGSDPASVLYVGLKKKAAERIGAELDIYKVPESTKLEDLLLLISSLNTDDTVHGIMIQMPLPEKLEKKHDIIINLISPDKDVDGLRLGSDFLHPTSKAVVDIIRAGEKELKITKPGTVCVVGATGMVGTPLVKEMETEGYTVIKCDTKTSNLQGEALQGDILISATGIPGIIKADMVKKGAIVVDVGSPKGDVDYYEVERKAAFITPVPGGVGPVTVSCLLENLISAC